jgi:hypothetical protein
MGEEGTDAETPGAMDRMVISGAAGECLCHAAVGDLSQTEVLARWGAPQGVIAGTKGETLWLYTVRTQVWRQPGGILVTSPGWMVPGGWRCTQFLFGFDRTQVLRDWSARPC